MSGVPSLWHPDQLHLAEWQALQQLEFIFNVTLSVDGKNMALAKLAKHKGLSRIDAEEALEPRRDAALNIVQVDDDGGMCDEDDVPEEKVLSSGLLAPILSEEEVMAFLCRRAEIQLAKAKVDERVFKTCVRWMSKTPRYGVSVLVSIWSRLRPGLYRYEALPAKTKRYLDVSARPKAGGRVWVTAGNGW
jgi:hypothetical protein